MSREIEQINDDVAVKVMGWKLADRVACGWGQGLPVYITGDDRFPTWQGWNPTDDHRAAHLVIDRMRALGFSLDADAGSVPGSMWRVNFFKGDDHGSWEFIGSAESESFTLAASLAALRAVGGEGGRKDG